MANVNTPFGFKLRMDLMGYHPMLVPVYLDASDGTATFLGDLIKFAGYGTSPNGYAPSVIQAGIGDAACGVLLGLDQITGISDANFNLYRKHRPASVSMYGLACLDPNALYEVQMDDVDSIQPVADYGQNADIIVGSGNTTTGYSTMQLDTGTTDTTATLVLKIISLVPRPDNAVASVNQKVIVKINNHQLGSHTGTVGV
jgi:hypothetical protein